MKLWQEAGVIPVDISAAVSVSRRNLFEML
jgi:hypothetical protein